MFTDGDSKVLCLGDGCW